MRIDRFLKLSRLVKRRTAAAEMVDVGAVRLNGRTVKSSADVKTGDSIEIAFPWRFLAVDVLTADESAIKHREISFQVTEDRVLAECAKPW
jgi:ribosomal 50S subunit-recycling heat shock protein